MTSLSGEFLDKERRRSGKSYFQVTHKKRQDQQCHRSLSGENIAFVHHPRSALVNARGLKDVGKSHLTGQRYSDCKMLHSSCEWSFSCHNCNFIALKKNNHDVTFVTVCTEQSGEKKNNGRRSRGFRCSRCDRDAQTIITVNGVEQKARFSFETFRFVQQKTSSTFYLHCTTRLCERSSCPALVEVCVCARVPVCCCGPRRSGASNSLEIEGRKQSECYLAGMIFYMTEDVVSVHKV